MKIKIIHSVLLIGWILFGNPSQADVMIGAAVTQELETQSQIWYSPSSANIFFKPTDFGFYLSYQTAQWTEKSASLSTIKNSESFEGGISYDIFGLLGVRPYLLLGAGQRTQTLRTVLSGQEQTFKNAPEMYWRPGVGIQFIFFSTFSAAPQVSYQFFQTTSSPVLSFSFIFGIIF